MVPHRHDVLFVTKADLSGRSGSNIITRNIVSAFADRDDVRISVVSPRPAEEYPDGFTDTVSDLVHLDPRPPDLSVPDRLRSSVDTFRTVRRAIRTIEPDVVIARMAPDFVATPFLADRYGIPYALLSRGVAYKRLRFSPILRRIYRYNVRIAREVYVASAEIKRDTDRLRRPDQSESVLLSNAVDPGEFHPYSVREARDSIGLDGDVGFLVGFVGSMKPYHRIDALIRSLQHLDPSLDVHLLLVGEGPELDRYEEVAEEQGVSDRVHFPGFVAHSNVDRYLSACDTLYAVRSQESGTPVKVFEYLACERPVIVRDMEELSFVDELEVGRTVPEPEPGRIAEAIGELHGAGRDRRLEMGERGRDYVERERTWDAFVQRILDDFFE